MAILGKRPLIAAVQGKSKIGKCMPLGCIPCSKVAQLIVYHQQGLRVQARSRDDLLMSCRHAEGIVEEHLDSGHDHSRVGVTEPVIQDIHKVINLLLPRGPVVAGKLQNLTLRPL